MRNLWFGYEDEPYRSKPKKRKNKRSKHKHEYAPCLIRQKWDNDYIKLTDYAWHEGSYCIHCGYIRNIYFSWGDSPQDDSDLPKFEIDSLFKTRYVDLNENA